jgi:large subunit ribosomal protein L10
MENPRPEKVAVVAEVKAHLESADAALLTEYRGINVGELATLRRALREAGGEYRIYKNTLVRIASRELGLELDDMLTGPTAIAFVPTGGGGDPVAVAKALREFARGNPNLVVKGGVLGDKQLSDADVRALADVAPREELLARLAGAMAAPMQQFAGLLQAVPRNFAYGLSALIEQGGAPGAPASAPADASDVDNTSDATTEAEVVSDDAAPADAGDAGAAPTDTPSDAAAAGGDIDNTPEATTEADTTAPADAGDTQES